MEISVLGSGSSGNSIYINNGQNKILVDAGFSGKELEKRLNIINVKADDIDAILITHEHDDHICGAGVISRRYNIPLYANELTWQGAAKKLGKIVSENQKVFSGEFMLGDFGIRPFSISHDALDPVGFLVQFKGKKIGIATDMGYVNNKIIDLLYGSNFIVLEANHDLEMLMTGSYPWYLKNRIRGKEGHLSNDDTAAVLPKLINSNNPRVLLAHLSKENNIPDIAYITVKNNLVDKDLSIGRDLELSVAFRDRPTEIYKIG